MLKWPLIGTFIEKKVQSTCLYPLKIMPLCLLQHMIAMIPAAGPLFTGNAASSLSWSGILDMWVSCWNRPEGQPLHLKFTLSFPRHDEPLTLGVFQLPTTFAFTFVNRINSMNTYLRISTIPQVSGRTHKQSERSEPCGASERRKAMWANKLASERGAYSIQKQTH